MFLYQSKRTLIVCVIIFFCFNSFCFADNLETQLSSNQVEMNEPITVTYIANNNTNIRSPDFSVLQKDFQIVNTNYGNSIKMINGVTTIQTFWRLELLAKRSGELWIPAVSFGNEHSNPHKIIVTANSITPSTSSSQLSQSTQATQNTSASTSSSSYNANQPNAPVFIRSEISTHSPYTQSQVIYNFKLFFRTEVKNPSIQFPTLKDVTFLQLNDSPAYQTTINGYDYNVVEKHFAVFPKQPGNLILPPIQFHAYIPDDNFYSYGNPFFFDELKPITIATKNFNLTVKDVPANFQGNTWLPAKEISLTQTWSHENNNWEAGTPVTRTIRMTAKGLRSDQLPNINIEKITDMNVYVDQPKRSNITENNFIVGVLEQKVTYIPNKSQAFLIPSIKINWWNTETNSNAISQLDAANIQVKINAANVFNAVNAANTTNASNAVNAVTLTSNNVTSSLSSSKNLSASAQPINAISFYKSIWFWIACVLLSAWLITLWFIFRKKFVAVDVVHKQSQLKQSQQKINLNEKEFEQACLSGEALQAQQFLLAWAKKRYPDAQINLTSLRKIIVDEQLNAAIEELEQVIYARKTINWKGETLLSAFQNIKKSHLQKSRKIKANQVDYQRDILPPLNP